MTQVRRCLDFVRKSGKRRSLPVKTVSMGRERVFDAYDVGEDTFVVERGIVVRLNERPSVLIVRKTSLGRSSGGMVMTFSSGNHSVAAFPLLDGRFWKLSRLPAERRSAVLMKEILCANVVGGCLEISQREVPASLLVAADNWLMERARFAMDGIVMVERNETALEHYRRLGQEWRVKPLAWTENEMRTALAASRKRISSCINYYHSSRGVHFLSFAEFSDFAALSRSDLDGFTNGLRELAGIYEGNDSSFLRMPKYRGHHEIEFFGMNRGLALRRLVPEIERLLADVESGTVGRLGLIGRADAMVELFRSLLNRVEFANSSSKEFVETMYMHITGEVYSIVGGGATKAFDDRRTALPGATFENGRLQLHPGADSRTEVLLSNLRGMLSKDELVEYANVYELRDNESQVRLGKGLTREIVYKTNLRPLEASLIEKGLSSKCKGYAEYMLSRVGALRSLGINLSGYYRLLRRRAMVGRQLTDFYIRLRCDGETMESIPKTMYNVTGGSEEDPEVVLGMAALLGDAAAQTMAMKKFDPRTESPLFGVGKEIYSFEYDMFKRRILPKSVSICSVRGSFGWPDLEYSDMNLQAIAGFYFTHFAHALKIFQREHRVEVRKLAERFMEGFEVRTHALAWKFSVMRDKFEAFRPPIPKRYGFDRKWRFALWALENQERKREMFRKMFYKKLEVVVNEDIRNNSK